MKKKHLCALVLLSVALTPAALAGDASLNLSVTPDEPVVGGDTIEVSLSGGDLFDFALLFGGEELGETPFGDITLDLIPQAVIPLGFMDENGEVGFALPLPDELPPELSGFSMNLQGVSVGFDWESGTMDWQKSNLDAIAFG